MFAIVYSRSKDLRCKALLKPTDPEPTKIGGRHVTERFFNHDQIKSQSPRNEQKLMGNGRVQFTGTALPKNLLLVICNLYLWTKSHTDRIAAQRSDSMIATVFEECYHTPKGPKMLCGDFNCNTSDLPPLASRLDDRSYIDLGSHAYLLGREIDLPTCYPHNNGTPCRRKRCQFTPLFLSLVKFLESFRRRQFFTNPSRGLLIASRTLSRNYIT